MKINTNTILLLLSLLGNLVAFITSESYDEEPSNAIVATGCTNGPDDLMYLGAKRTCIDSTAYDGRRCYYTYIPECATEDSPLVFSIHGMSFCPKGDASYTGWVQKATDECFVLVLPLGNTNPEVGVITCWSFPAGLEDENGIIPTAPCCCIPSGPEPVMTDDATFLRQVAEKVVQDIPIETSNTVSIDAKRIYMAGHSNGCVAAISTGILHSDMVAAVGCHSGFTRTGLPDAYIPTPMMFIHGNKDPTVPFTGSGDNFAIDFMSQLSIFSIISEANGCVETSEIDSINAMANNYTTYTSTSCANNADVTLVELDGVGHYPYYGYPPFMLEEGTVPTLIDTTQMAWDFMKTHRLSSIPDGFSASTTSTSVGKKKYKKKGDRKKGDKKSKKKGKKIGKKKKNKSKKYDTPKKKMGKEHSKKSKKEKSKKVKEY